MDIPDVAVIGAGAWGQALAIVAARAGNRVALWARRPDTVRDAAGRSPRLGGLALPDDVVICGGALPASAHATLVAVPVQHLRPILAALPGRSPLVFCCKGIEAGSSLLPREIADALQPGRATAVLGGPNFAREVAALLPAASVVAAADAALAEALAGRLALPSFRLYPGPDPRGCELAGAAKNVIAIAAGIATGAGLGENARAALVTRGLAEIARLVRAEGGRADTVFGLAGAGDLLLTCAGPTSRNFRAGAAIGRGEAPDPGSEVAEGIATAPGLRARARRRGVELPITEAVAAILDGAVGVEAAIETLLARPRQRE